MSAFLTPPCGAQVIGKARRPPTDEHYADGDIHTPSSSSSHVEKRAPPEYCLISGAMLAPPVTKASISSSVNFNLP